MMVYEVRVSLDPAVLEDWLHWIVPHMQQVVDTGCFTSAMLERVIDPADDRPTFRVRYRFNKLTDLRRYEAEYAPSLREEGLQRFGTAMSATRSVAEVVTATEASRGS